MKRFAIILLKYGISAAIIAWLIWDAQSNESFSELWRQPKNWPVLAAAWCFCMAMVVTTFIRWYYLVRALEIPFKIKDALRLGFLGFLFNFFSLGSVGGDVFKAIAIAREHRTRRPEVVATVLLDRVIGLFALFIVASVAILASGLLGSPLREIRIISKMTIGGTIVGAIGMLMVLLPGFTNGRFSEFLRELPRIGQILGKLIGAVRMYRRKPGVLVASLLMSFAVHTFGALGIYLVAKGLSGNVPSLGAHFVIVPLGMIVGVLPLPMAGLGAFEAVIEFLYMNLPAALAVSKGQGLVVSFGYRLITVTIAIIGLVYYLASRREVEELLHETEEAAASPSCVSSSPPQLAAAEQ